MQQAFRQSDLRINRAKVAVRVAIAILLLAVVAAMLLLVPYVEQSYSVNGFFAPPPMRWLFSVTRWLGGRLYPTQMLPGALFVLLIASGIVLLTIRSEMRRMQGR